MQSFGKYQLVRKLATGGMAEVFLANSSGPFGFEKTLVLKRILPHFAEDPLFTQMFLGEAKIAARLDHPNIVQVFDFGQVNDSYFLAMEYVDGPNLRTVKRLATERSEMLPIAICVKLAALACEGLAYAHDFKDPVTGEAVNLIHRDVSPDNILTSRVGAVKVADFGIAKASTGKNATRSGVLKGKLAYMPPEQLTLGAIDRRVDVFGLGMVLYELLTGAMPFDTTSDVSVMQAIMSSEPITPIAEMRKDIPAELGAILARALQKVPDARYPSCVAFQEDLEGFLRTTGESVSTRHLAEWLKGYQVEVSRELSPSLEPIQLMPEMRVAESGHDQRVPERTQVLEKDASGSYSSAPRPAVAKAPESLVYRDPGGRWMPVLVGFLAICLVVGAALWFLDSRSRRAEPPVVREPTALRNEPPPLPAEPERPVPPKQPVASRESPGLGREEPPVPRAAPTLPPAAPEAQDAAPVSVQFRVRPYASVYLDGRALGETPFGAVHVTPGTHKVRLVNSQLKMEKTVPLKVRSGHPMVFRYSFLE